MLWNVINSKMATNPSEAEASSANSETIPEVKSAVTWSLQKVSRLIELYERYPCLYAVRDKSYHNKDQRKKAISDIATTLEVTGRNNSHNIIHESHF